MQFLNPLKNHGQALAVEYKNKLLLENISRLKAIAIVGSSVNILIMLIGIGTEGIYNLLSAESILRLLWVAASFAYIWIIGRPQNQNQVSKKHYTIFFGATGLSLLFSGIIMSVRFYDTGYTFIYIINCMITCSFLYLSFFEIISVLMPTILYLIFIIAAYGEAIPNLQSNVINIIAVTSFSILISFMSYRSQVKLFDSQNVIREYNNTLKELAELDGLTQLPNRRKFDQVYSIEWAHANRDKTPLSIILIDIDYFKNYNDHYGHLAGDDCLKQISSILKASLSRQTDIVCRLGGDEFIAVLPNTGQDGAKHVAERVGRNIDEACIPHEDSALKQITLSSGIATLAEFNTHSKEELVSIADKAMYSAKQKGRNQIEADMLV